MRRALAGRARPGGVAVVVFFFVALGAGCRPELDDRPWLVTRLQIVGWKVEPPEAPPGASVVARVVALDGSGAAGSPDTTGTSWSPCHAPKPLGENRAVSPDCLAAGDDGAGPAAVGDPATLIVPADACTLFGPDTPQPAPGAPPTRPRDPDATGGYFQPVVIALGPSVAVGLERVTCDLPDASLAVARAFQAAYHANQNPTIASLAFTVDGAPIDPSAPGAPLSIPPNAQVGVEVAWAAGSAEPFALYDRAASAVIGSQETLVASWYVTAGALDRAAAAIDDASSASVSATWTAPSGNATVELVVMLRDSRGGSDMARATLRIGGG